MITHSDFKRDQKKLNLYFDKYTYKFSLTIHEVHWFRHVKTMKSYMPRLLSLVTREDLISFNGEYIKKFIAWRAKSDTTKYAMRIHSNNVTIYTNDLAIINSLNDKYTPFERVHLKPERFYTELVEGFNKEVIYQVKPKHKYRIYLKSRRYPHEERKELFKYLMSKPVKLGQSLVNWFHYSDSMNSNIFWGSSGGYWAYSSHCFDFDDDALITMLYLKFDNLIGKVCEIHKKINT